jgi:hypothetical protein
MSDSTTPAKTEAVVGMVVKPIPPNWFRSGAEAYEDAVIIQVSPFIMTSRHGDMRWGSTFNLEDVELTSEVLTGAALQKCLDRL